MAHLCSFVPAGRGSPGDRARPARDLENVGCSLDRCGGDREGGSTAGLSPCTLHRTVVECLYHPTRCIPTPSLAIENFGEEVIEQLDPRDRLQQIVGMLAEPCA